MRSPVLISARILAGAFLLNLMVLPLLALDESDRKQVEQLLGDKRFLSAWQLAERLDPANDDLDAVIAKATCLLHGLVLPAEPKRFFLKDGLIEGLDSGGPAGVDGLSPVNFPLLEVLAAMGQRYPDSPMVWSLLGSANYQLSRASARGGDQQTIYARAALDAYQKARQLGAADPQLLWRTGMLLTLIGDYSQAVALLQQSLARLDRNADLRFDLAYALWLKGDLPAALDMAKTARDSQKKPESQNLARMLMADIQFSMKDTAAALNSFQEIYAGNPANIYPLRRMIECSLVLGDNAGLERFTKLYAESLPGNPDALYALTMVFLQYGKQDVLFNTTHALKVRYAKVQPEVAGLMSFYEALVFAGTQHPKEALAALDESTRYLGSLYGPDHPVSRKIQEMYASLR